MVILGGAMPQVRSSASSRVMPQRACAHFAASNCVRSMLQLQCRWCERCSGFMFVSSQMRLVAVVHVST